MVAPVSGDRYCGCQADGRTSTADFAGERDWLLARIAEKPDLTLRAMVAELVERGVPASYGAIWRLLKAEGITVKKKPVRRRAGSPRRGPAAAAVEKVSEPA